MTELQSTVYRCSIVLTIIAATCIIGLSAQGHKAIPNQFDLASSPALQEALSQYGNEIDAIRERQDKMEERLMRYEENSAILMAAYNKLLGGLGAIGTLFVLVQLLQLVSIRKRG